MEDNYGSGWMCERVDGKFMCMTFDQYKEMGGFVLSLMVPYKEAFKREEGQK